MASPAVRKLLKTCKSSHKRWKYRRNNDNVETLFAPIDPEMLEFRVHHVRFFEYTPQAVQCMAYSQETERLALSRSDGSLELWSVRDHWYQEKVIPGKKGQSIEAIVWQGPRLFTAGLEGNVTEVDLNKLQVKKTSASNAGPVWCLTSNSIQDKLAAGTEHGCVVLFNTEHDQLDYVSRFDTQESRILCISWHTLDEVIVTGGIDNIRLWSVASGRALHRLTLGRQEKNKETTVWCIAVLSDMTIVSGDSRGKTCFWNGKQGTIIRSIQSHKADVYCLAVNQTQTTVVSSGVDPSLVQFNFVSASENSDWKNWVNSALHKQHSHDVRALEMVGGAIVSAGVDTNLIQTKLAIKGPKEKLWTRIRPLPHRSLVSMAWHSNVLLLQYPDYLEVWRLGKSDSDACGTNGDIRTNGDILPLNCNPVKLIQLKTRGEEPVYCCDISQDASVLAYSDCDTVRVYKVNIEKLESIQPTVAMSRMAVSTDSPMDAARCMCFTSDSQSLVTVTSSSMLQVLPVGSGEVKETQVFPKISDSLHLLTLSPDSKLAAVSDHACNVHICSLSTLQRICSVPRYSCQATALSFSPDSSNLAMVYSDQMILEFDLQQKEYSKWTKQNSQRFPFSWLRRKSKISGIAYSPSHPDQLIVHDEQMFCIIDKTKAMTPTLHHDQTSSDKQTKSAFHSCYKYKYLMYLDVLPGNWLVAVEIPPLQLYSHLPNALKQKKFGT